MKATVVIDVRMDTDNNQIRYDVALEEGDCTGLNQLAQALMKSVKASVKADRPPLNSNQGSKE